MAAELVAGRPHPGLSGVAVEYCGYRNDAPDARVQRQGPSACVPVIVDVGSGWHVAAPADGHRTARHEGFVAGMHDAHALVQAAGPTFGVQIDLTPIGARRLFGLPMRELTNRIVALDDVVGARIAARLRDRIGAARTWAERFAVVDATLQHALRDADPPSPGVEWAWQRLAASGGTVPVGSLAASLGWSRKRLIARFRDDIGLAPKTAARVLRFRVLDTRLRALRADPAAAEPEPRWADLALECGYFDQSHLIRDVRRLTGLTPTQLLDAAPAVRRETSVQDDPRPAAVPSAP